MTEPDFHKKLSAYIKEYTSPEDRVLAELNRETHVNVLHPRMLSGHIQGKLLEFISIMINPRYILEIGTFTGYSAICLSKGLQNTGHLHTIECNDEIIHIAQNYFKKAGTEDKITIHTGNALTIIPELKHDFDLIFIDADKKNYPKYYNLVFSKLKVGGYILADNVLWGGKVFEKAEPADYDTKGIQEFSNMVKNDNRVENLLLNIRDGLMIIRKISE